MRALGRLFDLMNSTVPVDLSTGTNTGRYISMKNSHGLAVVLFKGLEAGVDDPVLTFQQATSAAGAGVKNLAVITEYAKKEAVDITTVGVWTRVTQAASQTVTLTGAAPLQGIYVFEIESPQLDVSNGFNYVRVNIAKAGASAQLGAVLYLPYDLVVNALPSELPDLTL